MSIVLALTLGVVIGLLIAILVFSYCIYMDRKEKR